jgi:hypothetical protein
MTKVSIAINTLALASILAVQPASAAPAGTTGAPTLHVASGYDSCFFDLHSELTQAEFNEFAGELGSILRFRQLGDARPLGKGRVDVSLQYANTPIDDGKGAWNNTMSHPAADHYLGEAIVFPRIVGRFGVSDRVTVGAWGAIAPGSNYGLIGGDTSIAILQQSATRPVSLSIRPSATALLGPADMWAANASLDVSVSRTFGAMSPYAGVAASSSVALSRTSEVSLDPGTASDTLAYAGVSYRWHALVFSGEVENGRMFSYGFRVGSRF